LDQIAPVEGAHSLQVRSQRPADFDREHSHAVPTAFAIANEDLASYDIDILDAQPAALEQSQAGPIEHRDNDPRHAVKL
jgi:hypothetical protein